MEVNTSFVLRQICFSYARKQVLSQFDLAIPKGKITTLLGANGCGKSTLFQLLTKNLTPTQGKLYFEGAEVDNIPLRDFSRKVAIVHQNNTAPPDITVERLVGCGRTPYMKWGRFVDPQKDEYMIRRALKITGLTSLRQCSIHALSGGQRQRAWIAMALAQGTKTLLLDEPTTYLDIRYQIQILRLVQLLNQRYGMTIVMILHDINQALSYSDEIVALSPCGNLVAQGRPNEVITPENLNAIYGVDMKLIEQDQIKIVLPV